MNTNTVDSIGELDNFYFEEISFEDAIKEYENYIKSYDENIEFVSETYIPIDNREKFPIVKKKYGRISATFTRFEFGNKIACYVECKVRRKVPKPRGGFEMKEFTFNGNSLHTRTKKDFRIIPEYNNQYGPAFLELYKDFGIEPVEKYKHFYL